MIALLCSVLAILASPFKSKSRLEAENAALRHQLVVFLSIAPSSTVATLYLRPSLADFTTIIVESSFQHTQPVNVRFWGKSGLSRRDGVT
jgi:hypothetical protein